MMCVLPSLRDMYIVEGRYGRAMSGTLTLMCRTRVQHRPDRRPTTPAIKKGMKLVVDRSSMV